MADVKLTALSEFNAVPDSLDVFYLVDVSTGTSYKLYAKRVALTDGTLAQITGGGTIALAGYTLTLGASSTVTGSITGGGTVATAGYTLTVPATGTVDLLGTAQTISALKTFSAGISFGNETMSKYDEGTFTPTVKFGGGSTGISYNSQVGVYRHIGKAMFFQGYVNLSSKGSSTGTMTIDSLPVATAAYGIVSVSSPATKTPYQGILTTGLSDILVANVTQADISTGTEYYFGGWYPTA